MRSRHHQKKKKKFNPDTLSLPGLDCTISQGRGNKIKLGPFGNAITEWNTLFRLQ